MLSFVFILENGIVSILIRIKGSNLIFLGCLEFNFNFDFDSYLVGIGILSVQGQGPRSG